MSNSKGFSVQHSSQGTSSVKRSSQDTSSSINNGDRNNGDQNNKKKQMFLTTSNAGVVNTKNGKLPCIPP